MSGSREGKGGYIRGENRMTRQQTISVEDREKLGGRTWLAAGEKEGSSKSIRGEEKSTSARSGEAEISLGKKN